MAQKKKLKPTDKRKVRKNQETKGGRKSQKSIHPGQSDTWWTDKKVLLPLAGIMLLVLFSFLPMLNNQFTNWDDKLYVTENALLTDLSFSGISEIFTSTVVSNYHPITILSLAVNYQLSGLDPFSYYLTNLLFHLANTFLVFLFVYKLSEKKTVVALIVSLFFGIHPMHVESVAWISERKDVLFTFFLLLGLIIYLNYLKKPELKKYLIALLFSVLSLLSKPAAVVFPVLLLLIDYLEKRKFNSKVLLEKVPFFVVALAVGIATLQIQSEKAMDVMSQFSVMERIFLSIYGSVTYIFKFFFPFPLSALHPFPATGNLPLYYKLTPVIALAIVGLAYYFRSNRVLIFSLLFYLISIAPVLQFITIGNAVIAERYTYVPYIGLLFFIGYFYYRVDQKKIKVPGSIRSIQGVLGLFALAFALITFQRTKVWENSETLWTDVIEHYPDSHRAYMSRAVHYMDQQNYDQAISDFNQSLAINPDYTTSLEYRGRTYLNMGQYELALADFDALIRVNEQSTAAYSLRGLTYSKLNRTAEAMSDYARALELNPNNENTLNSRGSLYFNALKEYDKALEDFNRAIALNPDYGMAYLNRSRCYYMLNDKEKARAEANRAQQLGVAVPPDYLQLLQQ